MAIFSVSGTIRSLGQSEFNNRVTSYAFIEIIEANGSRTLVQNVLVGNEVAPTIGPGIEGEFFLDKLFIPGRPLTSQLWGVKTRDGLVAYDRSGRGGLAAVCLVFGMFTAVIGIGIPFVIVGLLQLIQSVRMAGARQRLFYGHDRTAAIRLREREAMRL